MNITTPKNFVNLKNDAIATENTALKRMMKQWEKKAAKNALRVGGFGMMAVSLAACGGNEDSAGTTTPTAPEDGVWSLIAGGLQLAGSFDPAIFAGGVLPAGVLIGDSAVLTSTAKNFVQGDGNPTSGDDLVLATTGSIQGARIDLAGGEDTIFIDVTGNTVTGLITNTENIELASIGGGVVNLSNVVDIAKVTISETTAAGAGLQVAGIRNTAAIELQGNFNQGTAIDFLNATGPLNLILNDYFQNAGFMNFAQDFSTVSLTSTGDGTLNAIDAGTLGANLQFLNIDGAIDFEVTSAITFRPTTEANIDASGFTGDNLTLITGAHNDVAFVGSAANDSLSVTTANASVGPDSVITLDADFGAGANTLLVNGPNVGTGLVNPDSSIASAGALELVINGTIDMTQIPAGGLAAITSVVIDQGAVFNLTAAQVAEIGIENFETPDFGNTSGSLNITATADEALDFSDIDVGTLVNLIVGSGDVTLNPATVLGNANAGVQAIIVDNRGEDSSVTMTAEQFLQLDGAGKVTDLAQGLFITAGTNNPATGDAYETGLVLTDLDPDTAYILGPEVKTTTTDIQLTDFTAGGDFDLVNNSATDLTITLTGDVDLSEVGGLGVNAVVEIVFADGASLTHSLDFDTSVNTTAVFEGVATLNLTGDNNFVAFNSDNIEGDTSDVTINFLGEGNAAFQASGSGDITVKAVNSGDDIPTVTVLNNLSAGATLDITGGSPALELGENTTTLTVVGVAGTITLIGTDLAEPGIVSDTLETINTTAQPGAIINLGILAVTSDNLIVNGNNGVVDPGLVTVEITEVPAGAAWVFEGVELEINADAVFGPGATIKLDSNVTLTGTFDIADLPLTSDSIVPLDADLSAAQIDSLLQSLADDQATVDATDMTAAQLQAVVDNSLKVDTISGDLSLTNALTPFEINTLSGLYSQGMDDVLNIDAAGMSTAQKSAAAGAVGFNTTNVTNLTLDSDDSAGVIASLLEGTANNSTTVDATDMSAGQLNALVSDIDNVSIINDMTLTNFNSADQITALLSKAAPDSVTVDATGMVNLDYAAIVEQITKIDVVENLAVSSTTPAEDFQLPALLELAVDAKVDASNMSDDQLSIVAENIANIADDGITNLTVSSDQTTVEIAALMGKAPDGTVNVDLSDMTPAQVAAVVAAADSVLALTVGENSSVTLTLAELTSFETAGLTPVAGDAASTATDTGGSIIIDVNANGTLDLALVTAGIDSGTDDNGGTLTLDIAAGVSLSVEGSTGVTENLSVTGTGTLVVTEDLDLTGLDLSVDAGVTIELAAANPGIELTLNAAQASDLANAGVTITKAAAVLPAVEGQIVAFGGTNGTGDPQDLSGLNLSLVDNLIVQDGHGNILPSAAADLPTTVTTLGGSFVSVIADTDWSASSIEFNSSVRILADATVTVSAATADESTGNFNGDASAAVGETGGSIEIVGLVNGVEYDFTTTGFNPGAAGGGGDAGTFVVSISSDVTLEEATVLPTTAQIVIDAGATLTVDADTAAQVDGSNDYEGGGTLNFVDLDSTTVTADAEVRFNTFVIEDTEAAVVINGFEAINIGGFNGQFPFDASTTPDTLGTMALDLTDFSTNGSAVASIPTAAGGLNAMDLSAVGVIIVTDGNSPINLDFGAGDAGAEVFFAYENGADVEVQYWDDTGATGGNDDGVVDLGELNLIATLDSTDATQLGSENFVI